MAKTLCSPGRGPRFHPWSGNWISHAATKTQRSQINGYIKKIIIINQPFKHNYPVSQKNHLSLCSVAKLSPLFSL